MIFSYRVQGSYFLKHIHVPVEPGKITLLTGKENVHFSVIGGILSGLFPVQEKVDIPQVEELVKYFTGELSLEQGEVPEYASYIGPDPERHLLFSTVEEEIYARAGETAPKMNILALFGLDEGFLRRKISTLSGGEKMKLGLCLVFWQRVNCLVLHGVVPWLDDSGRASLVRMLKNKAEQGASVVVLEQEITLLQKYSDYLVYFDGSALVPYTKQQQLYNRLITKASDKILTAIAAQGRQKEVFRFDGVQFAYEQNRSGGFLLKDVDISLDTGVIYGLIGENGSGKSTLAKLILRMEKPSGGKISFLDKNLMQVPRHKLKKSICFVGQFPEQFITLSSVRQYKYQAGKLSNPLSLQLLDEYFPEDREYPVSTLTPLQMKLLSLFAFINEQTNLVIIDEPTWGIDPEGKQLLLQAVYRMVDRLGSICLLVISHDLDFIEKLEAEILWLRKGSIAYYRNMDTVKKDPLFKKYRSNEKWEYENVLFSKD